MKIIKSLFISTTICSSLSFAAIVNPTEQLTGDAKLSCEAILCLSSSARPSECSPALKRYFSISHKRWKEDTLKSRRNFLNICPIHKERAEDAKLEQLVNLLVENPDACDIQRLNKQNSACKRDKNNQLNSNVPYIQECKEQSFKDSSCELLVNHEYTDLKLPKWHCDKKMSRAEMSYYNAIIKAQSNNNPVIANQLKRMGLEAYTKQLKEQQKKAKIFRSGKEDSNNLINYEEEVCTEASWVAED